MKLTTRKILITVIFLLYCGLAFYQLDLPGFYYDEALDLPPAIQLAQHKPVELMPGDPGIMLFGRTMPLMILDYLGTVYTYLLWPLFGLMGSSWLLVRWLEVVTGVFILALTYRLGRAWFGEAVGLMTILLLAVDPSFLFWTRMGISVTAVMTLCALGSLLAIHQWQQNGRPLWGLATGILLGIGLWAKFLFLWWLAALAFVFVIFNWRVLWPGKWPRGSLFGVSWQTWAAGFSGFILGAGPLICYNLRTGRTSQILLNALNKPTDYGINNLNVTGNLRTAWEQFRVFLDGSYFWYNGQSHSNPWTYWMFLISVLLTGWFAWSPRDDKQTAQRTSALLLLNGLVILQSAFTLSGIWATHLYILAPLLDMVMALAVWQLWRQWRRQQRWVYRLAQVAGVGLLLLHFTGDVTATARYHGSLNETGGYGRFSDAIYPLANYLEEQLPAQPAMLDWGLAKNILILTNGRVNPTEIFGYSYEPDGGFEQRVQAALATQNTFVLTDPLYAVFPRDEAFRQIANQSGYEISETKIFRERSGQSAYIVYRIQLAN